MDLKNVKLSIEDIKVWFRIIFFYKKHPVLAAIHIIGLKIPPHQRIIIRLITRLKARHIILLLGRAMGKTFIDATIGLLFATFNTLLKVLMIGGGGFRQGKLIIQEQERMIRGEVAGQDESKIYIKKSLKRGVRQTPISRASDIWSIPFLTNSETMTVPVGDGDKIRGLRSHVFILDEAKDMRKEIRDKVLRPMSFVKRNPVSEEDDFENIYIYSGTVEYAQDDYTQEIKMYKEKMESGDPNYLLLHFTYIDAFDRAPTKEEAVAYSKWFDEYLRHWRTTPYNVDIEEIERPLSEETVDIESWKAEVLCKPIEIEGNFFPYQIIKGASSEFVLLTDKEAIEVGIENNANPPKDYLDIQMQCNDPVIVGIDPGRDFDYVGIVVIRIGIFAEGKFDYYNQTGKSDFCNMIFAKQFQHSQFREVAKYIYSLRERYPNILGFALDKKGGGSTLRDDLYWVAKDLNIPVLFDPTDDAEGGIAQLLSKNDLQDPRLTLINPTDQLNTEAAFSVRGAMQKQKLLFPRDMSMYETEYDKIIAYKTIKLLMRQFGWIKTKPTSHWLNFYTKNPRKQKKDLFTATLYSWVLVDRLLKEKGDSEVESCAVYVY